MPLWAPHRTGRLRSGFPRFQQELTSQGTTAYDA